MQHASDPTFRATTTLDCEHSHQFSRHISGLTYNLMPYPILNALWKSTCRNGVWDHGFRSMLCSATDNR